MPIKILNPQTITVASEAYRVPDVWNPQVCNEEPVYLYMEDESFRSNYYKEVLEKNWAKWEKNVKPVESNEEDAEHNTSLANPRKSLYMNYEDHKDEEEKEEEEKDDGTSKSNPFS